MLSSEELYPSVRRWVQALGVTSHPTAQTALAQLVTALLVGQSLRSAALMRALLSPMPVPARQRYKRVARAWTRRWLSPQELTPPLVRAALALVPPDPPGCPTAGLTHVALDSVRCGRWEVFTLGVVWHGRVLPVGWAVLPYPWPKRQFTPTVCALLRQVAAAWPADRPVHLLADRAFPSDQVFRTLWAVGWGWTVRARATHELTLDGELQRVRALLTPDELLTWRVYPAAQWGRRPQAVVGTLVVGRGLLVLPAHQRGPGSVRQRVAQQQRRVRHLADKHPGGKPDASAQTDPWVVLFTSHPSGQAAAWSYRRRWPTEGTYRDAQSGWDGQHGWQLEATLARLTDARQVSAVVGLWALGTLVQSWVGDQVGQRTAPALVQAVRQEWTTTGRLSVWARGRLALTEPSGRLRAWLRDTLPAGADCLPQARPIPSQAHCQAPHPPPRKKAA